MSNTITIELSAEDRARLDRLAECLEKQLPPTVHLEPMAPAKPVRPVEPEAPTKPEAPTAEDHPVENPFPEAPEAPKHTMADVQQKVVALSAGGKKAQARDIVKQYAEKVSLIPEDKLDEVMAKLDELGG